MADEAKAAAGTAQDVAVAVKYTVDELKTASRKLFGYGPEVIDGAIYGKTETEYTVNEMRALVNSFLARPADNRPGSHGPHR